MKTGANLKLRAVAIDGGVNLDRSSFDEPSQVGDDTVIADLLTQRFVRKFRGKQSPQACAVIETAPGEEAQVDYGTGPMVRDARSGKYRRTEPFRVSLSSYQECCSERPGAVKGAPLLGAAKRTLDGEDLLR